MVFLMIRRSRKAEVYWWYLRKYTIMVQLVPWRWTQMIKLYVEILLTIIIFSYLKDLKRLIGVGLHLKLLFRRLFGLSEYLFLKKRCLAVQGRGTIQRGFKTLQRNAAYYCLSYARLSLAWLFALGWVLTWLDLTLKRVKREQADEEAGSHRGLCATEPP